MQSTEEDAVDATKQVETRQDDEENAAPVSMLEIPSENDGESPQNEHNEDIADPGANAGNNSVDQPYSVPGDRAMETTAEDKDVATSDSAPSNAIATETTPPDLTDSKSSISQIQTNDGDVNMDEKVTPEATNAANSTSESEDDGNNNPSKSPKLQDHQANMSTRRTRSSTTNQQSPQADCDEDLKEECPPPTVRSVAYAIANMRRQLFERGTPLVDGPISITRLGRLRLDNSAYWTTTMLYPVGFETRTIAHGTAWMCRIDANNDSTNGPIFHVALENSPATRFQANSPIEAWSKAMEFYASASDTLKSEWKSSREDDSLKQVELPATEDGFGLLRRSICRVVEGLENVLQCDGYMFWDERHGTILSELTKTHSKLLKEMNNLCPTQTETRKASKSSVKRKIDELRRRRQLRREEAKQDGLALMSSEEKLKFVEEQEQIRRAIASTSAKTRAAFAVYANVKALLTSENSMSEESLVPLSTDTHQSPTWTKVSALSYFPAELQRDVIWCWDFLFQYSDILRFRSLLPLPLFCQTLALHDLTAPQGDTVVGDENCHGRLLATLHIVLLEALLIEFTPYLQMSVAEFKKIRPLNIFTWPEVARQIFMVAWDVDKGDIDGNAIRILKGAKSSADNVIQPLREELIKAGEAIINKAPIVRNTDENGTSVTEDQIQKPDIGYGVLVDVPTFEEIGLVLTFENGFQQVQELQEAAPADIKKYVAVGDTLMCINGRDVSSLDAENLNTYVESLEAPVGLIFVKGSPPPAPKSKSSLSIFTRCANVLKILRSKEVAIPFNAPVDAEMYPDYYTLIPEPMDLGTVEEKILNDEYDDVDFFLDDVRLIWKNCFAFNGEVAPISGMARKLLAIFDRLVSNYIQTDSPFKDEDACRICRTSVCRDRLLLCDQCEGPFHLLCIRPPLLDVPLGEWYCPTCASSQPVREEDDEDSEDGDTSDSGLPQIIRYLSKENYMELTTEERVIVFKGLCELVQMCSSVQSVIHIIEDLAEEQRKEIGASYGDALREWENFSPPEEHTQFFFNNDKSGKKDVFVIDGQEYPLTEDLLAYIKSCAEAEISGLPAPPPYSESQLPLSSIHPPKSNVEIGDVKLDSSSAVPKTNDENSSLDEITASVNARLESSAEDDEDEVELLEQFGDIQLATHASSILPTSTSKPCYCCQLDSCVSSLLGEVEPAIYAPESKHIGIDLATAPQLVNEPITIWQCDLDNLDGLFKLRLDVDGHVTLTDVLDPETTPLIIGDYVVAINTTIFDNVKSQEHLTQLVESLSKPFTIMTCRPWANLDKKFFRLFHLPDEPKANMRPNVNFLDVNEPSVCQVAFPATGFAAMTDILHSYDVIYAINGTRITSSEMLAQLWQPKALLCVIQHEFNLKLQEATTLKSETMDEISPEERQRSFWSLKSIDMTFNAGPLGLALELDHRIVVVRSLTTISQATNKVQSGDIILAVNGKPIGPLNELTQFTDVVKTIPRPVHFQFYRPSIELPPPSQASILIPVTSILTTPIMEFQQELIVLEQTEWFSAGDVLTHFNGQSIKKMSWAWVESTLSKLSMLEKVFVCIKRRKVPGTEIVVHASCAALWNEAIDSGVSIQSKLWESQRLESYLKEIAPRTWSLHPTKSYYRFFGDPNTLYKQELECWYQTNQITAVIAAESTSPKVKKGLHETFVSPPSRPTSGPFALRSQFAVTPNNQHEAFIMVHGRQYYIGTYLSASEAEIAFEQSKQRYLSTRHLLAPFSLPTFPRVALPMLKAEDFLKRFQIRRMPNSPPETRLSLEMKDLARYSIRAHKPLYQVKPDNPPNSANNSSFPQVSVSTNNQSAVYDKQYFEYLAKRTGVPGHSQSVHELKTVIKQAWGLVQSTQSAPSCVQFTTVLQRTLSVMTNFANYIAKHPLEIPSPATFVSLHHAIVVCLLSIMLSECLSKSFPITVPNLQVMHQCGDNLLWSMEGIAKPILHSKIMMNFLAFAAKLPMLREGLTPDMSAVVLTIDLFFKSSTYLEEPASYPNCRPLFSILNNNSSHTNSRHIQPLPPALTQELWKLHTCQGLYEKMLRKLKVQWPPLSVYGSNQTNQTPIPAPQNLTAASSSQSVSNTTGQDTIVSFAPGPLGIIIQQEENAITVSAFAAGDHGQAIQSGKIAIGDMIVAVNGEPLTKIGIEGFKQAVTKGIRPLLITFRRPTEPLGRSKASRPLSATNASKEKQARKRAKQTPAQSPPNTTATPSSISLTQSAAPTPGNSNSGHQQSITAPANPSLNLTDQTVNSMDAFGFLANSPITNSELFNQSFMNQDLDISAFNTTAVNSSTTFESFAPNPNNSIWPQIPNQLFPGANPALYFSNMPSTLSPSPGIQSSLFQDQVVNSTGQNENSSVSDEVQDGANSIDFQAYLNPQMYMHPPAYRSGHPVEFVSQIETTESVARASVASAMSCPEDLSRSSNISSSKPSAPSDPNGIAAQDGEDKPQKRGSKKNSSNGTSAPVSTGRRSSRVSKKPEQIITTPIPQSTPTQYVPGAGAQGEYATDMLGGINAKSLKPSLAFSVLQAQLLTIEAALPRDAFRHNKWTRPLRAGWADLVVNATTSRALLEAMLVLEAQIDNEYLDASWKAHSMVAVKNLLPTATIASVAMRLFALDDALSFTKPVKRTASYKRKNTGMTTRRDDESPNDLPLPACSELTDANLHRLAVQKLRLAMQTTPNEICQKTLGELCGLTRLPTLILERWYRQCLDAVPQIPSAVVRQQSISSAQSVPESSPTSKRQKLRSRRTKQIEYRYEPTSGAIPSAVLKDALLPQRFLAVFEALAKNPASIPFLEPVDPIEVPDYRLVIKQPMDLGTIMQRLKQGHYNDRMPQVLSDIRLIWTNCFAYNSVQADISATARRFRSVFHRLFEEWIQRQPAGTPVSSLPSDDACHQCRLESLMEQLLLCDSCDASYHISCAGLDSVPPGNWYCRRCIENRDLL